MRSLAERPDPLHGLARKVPPGHASHDAQSDESKTSVPGQALAMYWPSAHAVHGSHTLCRGEVAPLPSTHFPYAMYSPLAQAWHARQSFELGDVPLPGHLACM
jgi:hypothetical protein